MTRTEFLREMTTRLYPVLRGEGFRGSGATLRRISGPVVHIFNVQGSTTGSRCYLNLGAHLASLPAEGGGTPSPQKILVYECAFRSRLNPPEELGLGWPYGQTLAQARDVVEQIVAAWTRNAGSFYGRYRRYPESFESLVAEGLNQEGCDPVQCLTLARIARELGHTDACSRLAAAGLEACPPRASGLRMVLRKLADSSTQPNNGLHRSPRSQLP